MSKSIYFGNSRSGLFFSSKEKHNEEFTGNVEIIKIPLKNSNIILMDHPASITIYQYVSIKALSGSVSVFGHEIKQNSSLKVFSSEKTGLIEVKTETFDRIWKKNEESGKLEEGLTDITQNKEVSKNILKRFGNITVAIVVQRLAFPPNLQYLELYFPASVDFNFFKGNFSSSREHYCIPTDAADPIRFNLEAEKLASEINIFVRHAKLHDGDAPRVLVCGPRNTGKSSILRFLVNKILSIYRSGFYLDCDPGQPEFTPPGLVSLTKLTKPVVGPNFTHQRKPVSMIFTGGISSDSSPKMYCKSICKLMDLYDQNFKSEPLFINTMGWIEGLGLQCLQHVITVVKPTVLLELVREGETSMFDYRDYLPEDSHYFMMDRSFEPKPTDLTAKEMRELSLFSYFGKCQSAYEGPVCLNEIQPYCVSWDKIPVYVFGKKVAPYRLVEALNASIVALCIVPETSILEYENPQIPKSLEGEPDNQCLGYGLVRAVDELKHLLYIITPLSLKELKRVNAIIKGNIVVPDAVFMNQPIYNTPLPYANEREVVVPLVTEEEEPDCSILSLKSISELESPAADKSACGSAAMYRKGIKKRYKRARQ